MKVRNPEQVLRTWFPTASIHLDMDGIMCAHIDGVKFHAVWDRYNQPIGIVADHTRDDGSWCTGIAGFDEWQVIKDNSLTLQPSIQCSTCTFHGFITDGHWVPA
jgi:hypothetical protein